VILIIDDEQMILDSLTNFFALDTDYEIKAFISAKEAIEFATNNDVELVISDFLMPEMDGISLLNEMRRVSPLATRILLTGFADKENAIKAINEVRLFQYIEKPWENADLKIIVGNGIERSRLLHDIQKAKAFEMRVVESLI